jgi:hypothetical protein
VTKLFRLAAAIIAVTGGLSLALGGAPGPAAASPELAARAAGPATGRAVASTAGWRVAYQSSSTRSNQVYGLTALSGSDAWAVGASAGSGGVQDEPLALQWNGQRWRSVTVPGVTGYYLPAVAASARTNLWIFAASGSGGDPKAVRWDGSQWQDIPLPAGVYPNDVAVLNPTDAWVVGPQQPCTGTGASQVCPTTLYHWDGSVWSPFTLPIVVDELSASALAASGPNHVWVVGASHPCAASPCSYRVRVYSWNGSTWGRWKTFPRVDSYYLPAVAISSGRNAWVGTWSTTNTGHRGRLLHWNGSRWSTVSAPSRLTAPTGTPMVTDGRNGVWLGPWARWTGTHWRDASGNASSACQPQALARIPGTTTVWGGGSVARNQAGSTFDSVVCAYPRVP